MSRTVSPRVGAYALLAAAGLAAALVLRRPEDVVRGLLESVPTPKAEPA